VIKQDNMSNGAYKFSKPWETAAEKDKSTIVGGESKQVASSMDIKNALSQFEAGQKSGTGIEASPRMQEWGKAQTDRWRMRQDFRRRKGGDDPEAIKAQYQSKDDPTLTAKNLKLEERLNTRLARKAAKRKHEGGDLGEKLNPFDSQSQSKRTAKKSATKEDLRESTTEVATGWKQSPTGWVPDTKTKEDVTSSGIQKVDLGKEPSIDWDQAYDWAREGSSTDKRLTTKKLTMKPETLPPEPTMALPGGKPTAEATTLNVQDVSQLSTDELDATLAYQKENPGATLPQAYKHIGIEATPGGETLTRTTVAGKPLVTNPNSSVTKGSGKGSTPSITLSQVAGTSDVKWRNTGTANTPNWIIEQNPGETKDQYTARTAEAYKTGYKPK